MSASMTGWEKEASQSPSDRIQSAILSVADTVQSRAVQSQAVALLVRNPLIDRRFPDTSDLDFVVLADIEDLRSERLRIAASDGARTMADLTWIPWAWVSDPELAATRGWVPHRLLSSSVVWDSGRNIAAHCEEIQRNMYRPEVQQKRTGVFLDIGFHTVREIGITWDFPALALFWLHMGNAACLAAMVDGMRVLCPNVYTRPLDYLDDAEREVCPGLRGEWIQALRLDANPMDIILRLRRIHKVVAARFPEPDWPENIRHGTRFEYRYWLSPDEVEWRISAALEMARRGDVAAAVFYLRFCAYAVARIPMVHARSIEGCEVSFLRPEARILPELQRLVPEIIEDFGVILAGTRELYKSDVKNSISMLNAFRENTLAYLRMCGLPVSALPAWEPYQPQDG